MSTQLPEQLRALGVELDVPPAPDLVPAVRAQLGERAAGRRPVAAALARLAGRSGRRRRRTLALALGLTLALAGGALAVTPAREAVLRALGLRGATVDRVERLPPLPPDAPRGLELGRRIPLADAREAASFRALLPTAPADAAYLAARPAGGRVSLVSGPLVITQFRGQALPLLRKLAGPGTTVTPVRVDGRPGAYLSGAPHAVAFVDARGVLRADALRLAGDVLLWERDGLVLRIEGARTLSQALAVARTLR